MPTGAGLSAMSTATLGSTMCRFWEVECTDRDDNVYHDTQYTFKVVRLAIAQEGSDDKYGQDQGDGIEDGEVVIHVDSETPANKHN
jgi:hypothetical protein